MVVNGKCVNCNKNIDSSDDEELQYDDFFKRKDIKKEKKSGESKYEQPVIEPDPYPEICIPMEYVAEFEMKKNFSPGQMVYAERKFKDELKIRYL